MHSAQSVNFLLSGKRGCYFGNKTLAITAAVLQYLKISIDTILYLSSIYSFTWIVYAYYVLVSSILDLSLYYQLQYHHLEGCIRKDCFEPVDVFINEKKHFTTLRGNLGLERVHCLREFIHWTAKWCQRYEERYPWFFLDYSHSLTFMNHNFISCTIELCWFQWKIAWVLICI